MKRAIYLIKRWQFWMALPVIIFWVILVCLSVLIFGLPSIVIGFVSDILDKIVDVAPDYTTPAWLERIVRWGAGTGKSQ